MWRDWERVGLGSCLLLGLWIAGCSRTIYHEVRRGDTLSEIGVQYGVPYHEIAQLNNIANPHKIYVGQRLRIPPGGSGRPAPPKAITRSQPYPTASTRTYARSRYSSRRTRQVALATPPKSQELPPLLPADGDARFLWPVNGSVTSGFGPRNRSFHDGIDIAAPRGAPVLTAAEGRVIYNGELRGYGKVVIVKHSHSFVTVYAHLQSSSIKEGQYLRRGQHLGKVGMTGRATGPNLHFEIRKNNLARNPMPYLPQERRTVGR